jgi:hypothetical protein
VILGALLGAGMGLLVPRLHQDEAYEPRALEIYAMAGGVLLGALGSQLVPLETSSDGPATAGLVPLALRNGGGIAFVLSY